VEAFRVNCARFEPGRSIEPHVTLLLSDDTDTAVTTIGPVEQVRVYRIRVDKFSGRGGDGIGTEEREAVLVL